MTRVVVIGCGSIGTRRARILRGMGVDVLGVDVDPLRAAEATDGHATTLDLALHDRTLRAAVVCTPPATHVPIALDCLKAGLAVFVEKPLALSMDGVPDLLDAAAGKVAMGACNLRFAYDVPRLDWAQLTFRAAKPLREWREGAEAAYETNGIVMEMAWHELDLAYALAGPFSSMERDSNRDPDTVALSFHHANAARSTVVADWSPGAVTGRAAFGITYTDPARVHRFLPDLSDRMYEREMAHFLECVRTGATPCCTLEDAAHVLRWALEAQK